MIKAKEARSVVDELEKKERANFRESMEKAKKLVAENSSRIAALLDESIKEACQEQYKHIKVFLQYNDFRTKTKLVVESRSFINSIKLPYAEEMLSALFDEVTNICEKAGYDVCAKSLTWDDPSHIIISW